MKSVESNRHIIRRAILIPGIFVSLLWIIWLMGELGQVSLVELGILPRTLQGLPGIITGPLIHGSLSHLVSNTFPLLVLGFVIFAAYPDIALPVTGWVYWLTGFWVWVAARPVLHIGASGLVYGLASFLFFMGVFRWEKRSIAVALFVAFAYGSMIWGIFPIWPGVSWESHLFGGIAGLITARAYYKVGWEKPVAEDLEEAEDSGLPWYEYDIEGERKQPPETHGPRIRYFFRPGKDKKQP